MAIIMVKVITGEEVIADIELERGIYTLKNPVRVVMARDGMGIVPWSPFIKEQKVTLRYEHVIFTAELDDEVYNGYNSKFGSGIILAGGMPDLEGMEKLENELSKRG